MDVAERLHAIGGALAAEARACNRDPDAILILAVTKFQPAEAIREAVAAGVADIGENYVQEARAKFAALGATAARRHFIGHVQSSKAKAIVATFDIVQSVDRVKAAAGLAAAAHAAGKRLPVLLQVNISPTERYGCSPAEAPKLADAVRALPSLRLEGVMAIGPMTADRDALRRAFQLAADTNAAIGGSVLSIGMSGDWREAVRAGSTMIRLGTALFGPRPSAPMSKSGSNVIAR